MSFLTTSVRATLGSRVAVRSGYAASSAFHSSPFGLALKESDQSRDNLENFYEAEKQDQLQSTKTGQAKWKQELASNSESAVKADRGEIDSDDKTVRDMQQKTKDLPNRKGPVNKTQ